MSLIEKEIYWIYLTPTAVCFQKVLQLSTCPICAACYCPSYGMRTNIVKVDVSSSFKSQKRFLGLWVLGDVTSDHYIQQLQARGFLLELRDPRSLSPRQMGDGHGCRSTVCRFKQWGRSAHIPEAVGTEDMDKACCTDCCRQGAALNSTHM